MSFQCLTKFFNENKANYSILYYCIIYYYTEPLAFSGAQFGVAEGPIVYSNVDCGGWESDIQECMKSNHLQIQCSHSAVAGVMCSDGRYIYIYIYIIIIISTV